MKFKLIFVIFIALLASCASRTYTINLQRVDVKNTVAKVRQNHRSFNSLRGVANVSILTGEDKIKFRQVTVAKKNSFIRLEALAIFGAVIAQIFSDSEKVYLNTRYEQLVFNNTQDFRFAVLYPDIPRDIGVSDLVNVLLANPSDEIWNNDYKVGFDGSNGKIIVNFNSKEDLTLTLDPGKKVIERLSYNLLNGQKAVVEYGSFKNIDGNYFPFDIQLKTDNYNLSITYNSDLEINPQLDISIFQPNV